MGSLVAMALIPLGMLLFFRRKEWWLVNIGVLCGGGTPPV